MDILEELEITLDYFQSACLSYDIIDTIYEWNMEYIDVYIYFRGDTNFVKYPSLFGKIWTPKDYMVFYNGLYTKARNGYITHFDMYGRRGRRINNYYVWECYSYNASIYTNNPANIIIQVEKNYSVRTLTHHFTRYQTRTISSIRYQDPIEVIISSLDENLKKAVLVKKTPDPVEDIFHAHSMNDIFANFKHIINY